MRLILCLFLNFAITFLCFSYSQNKHLTSLGKKQYTKYYGRYDFFKDIFSSRNDVVFTVDFYIWQKDDGSGNYIDTSFNREIIDQTVVNLNRFYTENPKPTFVPLPNIQDYSTTKIHFKLGNIYFERDSTCWVKGGKTEYSEGVFLNRKADSLHPKGKNHLKIHIVNAYNTQASGFSTFPTKRLSHQHFIVTTNKSEDSIFQGTTKGTIAWALAIHLAHEMGHNLNLYHTYQGGHCNENNPDYLDDVFGSSKYNSKQCPQKAGWDCDYTSSENTCTNNIMGGTKAARYFSPKQIQRMHRSLAYESIRKYATAYQFNPKKFIVLQKDTVVWTENIKLYTNLKIGSGTTFIVKGKIAFVPKAKLVVEPGATLVLDGGVLTSGQYYKGALWRGIYVLENKRKSKGTVKIINRGQIKNAFNHIIKN